MKSKSFSPIVNEKSRILILGTMPGLRSLEQQQYYAHERNAFWPIIFELLNEPQTNDYKKKINILLKYKIALWDTLDFCSRKGSLDSDIQEATPNDINGLIRRYPNIKTVAFNGQYAEKFYKKFNKTLENIRYLTLPSTSPANARMTFQQKLDKWSELKKLPEILHL